MVPFFIISTQLLPHSFWQTLGDKPPGVFAGSSPKFILGPGVTFVLIQFNREILIKARILSREWNCHRCLWSLFSFLHCKHAPFDYKTKSITARALLVWMSLLLYHSALTFSPWCNLHSAYTKKFNFSYAKKCDEGFTNHWRRKKKSR